MKKVKGRGGGREGGKREKEWGEEGEEGGRWGDGEGESEIHTHTHTHTHIHTHTRFVGRWERISWLTWRTSAD